MIIHYFFKYLFMFAACIVAMPCSAVIYQYASMVNPVTGHHVHLLSDAHFGLLDTTLKQVDDLSKFVKNIKESKELIVEDMASKEAIVGEGIENIYISDQHSPLKYSELGYALQNVPVHNVEFRLSRHFWSQVFSEALDYDDSHPIIKDYYARTKRNFDSIGYDPSIETGISDPVYDMLNMRIIHRIRHNEKININHSIVMAGGRHIDGVQNFFNTIGYQTKIMQGMTIPETQDFIQNNLNSPTIQNRIQENFAASAAIDILNEIIDKMALDIPSATRQE